jgi:Fungal chitosanase of glycosyl hydrolase group 75
LIKHFIAATFLLAAPFGASHTASPESYSPPQASAGVLSEIDFASALPVDEEYRGEFGRCDRENIFRGVRMTGFSECSDDPNRVEALSRFPDGTIFFESKLALDLDGSYKACHDPGETDQCSTWYRWPGLEEPASFVDSEKFPYVVIPISGNNGGRNHEFRDQTGVNKGDVGVVVYKDKVVPVFVADGGPGNKLGEGSAALFRELGEDRCRSMSAEGHCEDFRDVGISREVLFFLFPNSSIEGLTPANAIEKIRREALRRFAELQQGEGNAETENQGGGEGKNQDKGKGENG